MKRTIALILTMIMIAVSICSCTISPDTDYEPKIEKVESELKNPITTSEPTVIDVPVETIAEEATTISIPKPIIRKPTIAAPVKYDKYWTVSKYVDSFNMPTNNKYLYCGFECTYSNAAVTNEEGLGILYIDKLRADDPEHIDLYIEFSDWTYTYSPDKAWYDTDYIIYIKKDNGEIIQTEGTMLEGDTLIRIRNTDEPKIIELLSLGETLIFRVEEKNRPYANHIFSFGNSDFAKKIELLG